MFFAKEWCGLGDPQDLLVYAGLYRAYTGLYRVYIGFRVWI